MAYEKEFHVRVNQGLEADEVILREVEGTDTLVTRPSGDERGYFKDGGRVKGVFTMIAGSVPHEEAAETGKTPKK